MVSSQTAKSSTSIEIATIASIVVIYAFVELNFGFLHLTALKIVETYPSMRTYGVPLLCGIWVGLTVYSLRRRYEAHFESEARKQVEEDLEIQRIVDPVTGLPNRNGLRYVLNQRLRSSDTESFSILGVEICNIETITSVHGPDMARRVKIALADYMVALSDKQNFVARSNRMTFYMLIANPNADERMFRIDQLVEAISHFASAAINIDGLKLQAYVNFGTFDVDAASQRAPDFDADSVLRRVDFALGRSRKGGHRATETFDELMEKALRQRALMEVSLSKAISNGEIIPYFQPFVDLGTNRIAGVEVLARWQHPTEGQISPAVFIPVAEEIGVLRLLTLSILRQACTAALTWPEEISLAINISPTELSDREVMDSIIAILRETGIDPKRIEIEITENAFIEEADAIAEAVEMIKAEGVSISIDDFGTGYSSLHHLRILPFDKIKIDQSFVNDLTTNADSQVIIQTVIALGNSLGLPTTAEGIEAVETRNMLRQLGCTIGQGNLISPPLPQTEIETFLRDYRPDQKAVTLVA